MPNQIQTFGMSKMAIGSFNDFHNRVNKFIQTATPAVLHIEHQAGVYAEAICTLELEFDVEALREANTTFDTQYYARTTESGVRKAQSCVKS